MFFKTVLSRQYLCTYLNWHSNPFFAVVLILNSGADLRCYASPDPRDCEKGSCPSRTYHNEGNASELVPQTAACGLKDQLYCAKVRQLYFISKQPSRCSCLCKGTVQQTRLEPLSRAGNSRAQGVWEEETKLILSPPAAEKPRNWRCVCAQQLEGRLLFPLKLGKRFLVVSVTSRVFNRSD